MEPKILVVDDEETHRNMIETVLSPEDEEQIISTFNKQEVKENFTVVDIIAGYRLPSRYGILSAEIRNVFDQSFKYMGTDIRSPKRDFYPEFLPERTYLVQFTLSF